MFARFPTGLVLVLSVLMKAGGFAASSGPRELPPAYVEAVREAVIQFSNRDFPKTREALDRADAMLPPTPLTLNTRGAILIEERKFEEGAEFCRRALEIDPQFYPARFNLCEIPMIQRRYAEAREQFLKILDEYPRDELVMFRIMLTHLVEKDDAAARRVLDRIPFPGSTCSYYYANAAWEFAHGNEEEAHKWMKRGNWVFKPQMTINFADAMREIGWIKTAPGTTETLPEMIVKGIGEGGSKLGLTAPEPPAPLVPPKKLEEPVNGDQ